MAAKGRTLTIDGNSIEMEHPIEQTIMLADRVNIRVDDYDTADDAPTNGRNIFAVDFSGKEIWRIDRPGAIDKTGDGRTLISS